MSVTFPDEVLHAAGITETELRAELAVSLFQTSRLTLGQASSLAGIPQLEFQRVLASRQIPIHYDADDLDEDLRRVRDLRVA